MKRLLATLQISVMAAVLMLGAVPVQAGIVSQLTDTVSVHTTSAAANHTFKFVTPTGVDASSDTIRLTFASGFSLASLSAPGDFDLAVGSTGNCSTATFTDKTLAATAAAATWGVAVSGQAVTFTAPTDAAAGEITAGRCVLIEIGTVATNGSAGVNRITNPGTTGSKTIWLSGAFGDSGETAVAITSPGQVTVSATVSGGSSGGGGAIFIASPPPDTVAPIISNVRVPVIGSTSVEIAWDTNEVATSMIDYGLTTSYEIGTITDTNLLFIRQLPVGGLTMNTTYHYRVRSVDGAGNSAQSGDYTFQTIIGPDVTPPQITGINVTNITGSSATIGWTTNEPADAKVEYGLTNDYNLKETIPAPLTTTHLVTLTGLSQFTTYHFSVLSVDEAGNGASSADATFMTLDDIPPTISDVFVTGVTQTQATVRWTTSEPTTGALSYATGGVSASGGTTPLGTQHELTMTGLVTNTPYTFVITATDQSTNSSTENGSFRTQSDTTPPAAVSNLTVTPGDTTNQLTWTNPPDSDFANVYVVRKTGSSPTGPYDGTIVYQGSGNSFLNTGLTNGTRYYYAVWSRDTAGNFAAGALGDGTPYRIEEVLPTCGNNVCDGGENNAICPIDCPLQNVCGNGMCDVGEDNASCPADCPVEAIRDLNSFAAGDIEVTVRNRGVMIRPNSDGMFEVLSGTEVMVAVPDRVIASEVASGTLTVGNEQYRMFKGGSYDAIITLPNTTGLLSANVQLNYTNGNYDQAFFQFNLVDQGLVYEMVDGQQTPVAGAAVTLFSHANGKQFAGSATTDANGHFSFVVQPGMYSVAVEKSGYGEVESTQTFSQSVVHPTLVLVKVKEIEEIKEILTSEAPVIDKVTTVIDQAAVRVEALRNNPVVQQQAEEVVAPAATTVAVANAITVVSVGAVANASAWFQYLFLQPILWFSRRKRKGWGTVYDSLTKLPIDLAVVRLADAATGRILQSRVTDREGRYFFIADAGRYRIMVAKPGYAFPTEFLKNDKEDVKYTELYHSEDIVVTETGSTIAANIPLDPVGKPMVPAREVLFKTALRKFQLGVSVVGIFAGAVAAYLNPTPLTMGLMALQFALFIGFRKVAKGKKPKGWGIVSDHETKLPLANAIVRIFEPRYNKLLDTVVTDARGRYAFIVGPNTYYTTYERTGYAALRQDNLDYTKVGDSAVVDVNVALNRAGTVPAAPTSPAMPAATPPATPAEPPVLPNQPPGSM